MSYGIILWDNSYVSDKKKVVDNYGIFEKQNGAEGYLESSMYILPLASEYMLALTTSITENLDMFATNSVVHTVNKMHKHGLQRPGANPTVYHKHVYTIGIKLYTKSPSRLNIYPLTVNKLK
jgi:hypothetical protein